jgi:hypothetical protein
MVFHGRRHGSWSLPGRDRSTEPVAGPSRDQPALSLDLRFARPRGARCGDSGDLVVTEEAGPGGA